ncbi:MAG: flippase-like domain-containing protein [Saprospirales bacterium]|nr:flippase-like domain-containing protein [Saprospirales bacterium]MBK8921719.1 flippase-like domain-containing protein [Saprospirales bacterium]
MMTPDLHPARVPPSKMIRRGIRGFIFFSALGTFVAMWWKRPAGLEEIINRIDWSIMPLLIPLIALDFWLGGFRFKLYFDGKTFAKVSQWNCMRSNWANMFMGAITPFQTGSAPAQFYILWRKGVSVTDALLVSSVNFGATLIFFLLSSAAALFWIPAGYLGKNFTPLFQTGFVLVGSVAGAILILLLFPYIGHRAIQKIVSLLPFKSQKTLSRRDRLLMRLEAETDRFGAGFRVILKRAKWKLLLTVIATLVLFSNKYLMGYVIARAIGQDVPFALFFGLQVVQLLVVYFAPTPGASGVAEVSSVWLMEQLMPQQMLLVYTVLWRFSSTLLGAICGAVVLLKELGTDTGNDSPADPGAP